MPHLICANCNSDLFEAYKFREDFLKVQTSFKSHVTRANKKLKSNCLIKETEFVQVLVVKEEKNVTIGESERTFEGEEKEFNFSKKEFLSLEETNALELKPCEENISEDAKNAIDHKINKVDSTLDYNFDETEIFSDFEEEGIKESDEEYNPNGDKKDMVRKCKLNQHKKKIRPSGRKINESKDEIVKSRKKRKDDQEHPKLFICDQCGNHFTCRHHFKLHLRRHSGDKRCACE